VDDSRLRDKARGAMRAGTLPNRRPERIWGGPGGTGPDCAVCGEPVTREELGYEVDFPPADGSISAVTHQFHVPCFAAWETELQGVPEEPERSASRSVPDVTCALQPPPGPAPEAGVLPGVDDPGKIAHRERDSKNRRGTE
jgi:hypothetical protein